MLARYWGAIPFALAIGLFALRACVVTPPLDRLAIVAGDPKDPPGTTARAGSLEIVRGGPVIVGFVSPSTARLSVAGHELVRDGVVKERIVLPHGPVAIRFAAPPGARLVWSPVGRRGDPEYVPVSSLSPEPPERAQFGSDTGAAPFDGVIALALLLVVVGTLLVLVRDRLRRVPRAMWIAIASVLGLALLARLIDLGGFGQTWDEDVNWASGRNYVTNLLSGDFSAAAWQWNFEHPPVMKLLDGIGAQFADGYGPARALSALWLSLGCALLVPIGARLYRLRTGVLAGGIAALLPPLIAHGQIVGHESPTVLWWALAVLLALTVHDELESTGIKRLRIRLAWVGVVIGIAIASRFVNGLVGVLAALIVVVNAPAEWRRKTMREAAWILPLAAILTFYAVWPRLWAHPIHALSESLAKLTQQHSPEPFLGAMTTTPGASYFVIYLCATVPLGVLAGVLAGAIRCGRERTKSALVAIAFLVIPLGVALSPVRQDGVRYVMPSVVAFALLAAAGFDMLATWLEPRARHAFLALAAALLAYLAIVDVRIHPYYLDYFAEQVGGSGTVAEHGWFETAWWGEGVDRAVAYVNEHAAPGARVDRDCIEPAHLAWFRGDLWTPMTHDPRQADWIVTYAPSTHHCDVADARKVFEITAGGAVLAEVWQRSSR
ncbi:MAG: 4-amino-4-deoxy-L-arabinose transferase and related glycosyltransferase of family-like protein [Myxococcales bacterium]|nr:4-amino-4-deoxy-L-arabinose transferase and related glycosyltransferase of family-like protein [Myxococcales bacterium]